MQELEILAPGRAWYAESLSESVLEDFEGLRQKHPPAQQIPLDLASRATALRDVDHLR
jgi:hypothetical protein